MEEDREKRDRRDDAGCSSPRLTGARLGASTAVADARVGLSGVRCGDAWSEASGCAAEEEEGGVEPVCM